MKLAGSMSNGMVMCASNSDKSVIELIRPADGAKLGERVQLRGNPCGGELPSEMQAVLNPKKKVEQGVLALLETDEELNACYNGIVMEIAGAPIKAKTLKKAHIS